MRNFIYLCTPKQKRSVRITVSTQDSQSCNRGSIPLPSTKFFKILGVELSWLEHLLCKQGVVGSTPTISTSRSVRITVSTQDSQSCNRGSIPLPSTRKAVITSMTAFFVSWMDQKAVAEPAAPFQKLSILFEGRENMFEGHENMLEGQTFRPFKHRIFT